MFRKQPLWRSVWWLLGSPAISGTRIQTFFLSSDYFGTQGVRRAGSAALDLCYVAAGRLDGFWEFNLNSWDTAAGVLIVEEAGGKVTRFNGEPFEINSRETLASNGVVHPALMQEFEQIIAGRGLDPLPEVQALRK